MLTVVLLLSACSQWRSDQIRQTETRIDVVRQILEKNWTQLRTLRGTGRIIIESPTQSFSGYARVSMKIPDSTFIKIEAILGLDVGAVFADEKSFLIYSPTENIAYQGESRDTLNLKRLLGFNLTFPQLMHTISGVPLLPELNNAHLQREGKRLKITGERDRMFYSVYIDTKYGAISKMVIRNAEGQVLLVEEYKRFVRVGSSRAPKMIRYMRPREKESLTIFYDQLEVNKSLRARDFYVKMPQDVFKIRL